ncbi:MAG: hypothetical protein HY722_06050 [Planctomycetes bacterium]|nr:hypothetical protein [Planctomycetota bacterium]
MIAVLSDVAARFGVGYVLAHALCRPDEAGRRFARFTALVVLASLGLVLALPPHGLTTPPLGGAALVLSTGLALLAERLCALRRNGGEHAVAAAAVAGTVGIFAQGLGTAGRSLAGFSALSGALVLGAVFLAMILGHFYLVVPKLAIAPLQRSIRLLGIGLATRTVVLGIVLVMAGPPAEALWRGELVFFALRVLFGLAAPAVLAWMAWEGARLRATRSATGILYGACVLVLAGEGAAVALAHGTGVPI